jgi:hypothetical protein
LWRNPIEKSPLRPKTLAVGLTCRASMLLRKDVSPTYSRRQNNSVDYQSNVAMTTTDHQCRLRTNLPTIPTTQHTKTTAIPRCGLGVACHCASKTRVTYCQTIFSTLPFHSIRLGGLYLRTYDTISILPATLQDKAVTNTPFSLSYITKPQHRNG